MPIRKTKKTTLSLAIKKGKKFVSVPRVSHKTAKQFILGKKKVPNLFVVTKKAGKVIKSKRIG